MEILIGFSTGSGGLAQMPVGDSTPATAAGTSRRIVSAARDNGLVLCAAATSPDTQVLLVAPPLTSSADDIVELETRLDAALHQL